MQKQPVIHRIWLFGLQKFGIYTRFRQSDAILRDGKFEFQYALNTNCLDCKEFKERKECVESFSNVEKVMVKAIEADKKNSEEPLISELDDRMAALEKMYDQLFDRLGDSFWNNAGRLEG